MFSSISEFIVAGVGGVGDGHCGGRAVLRAAAALGVSSARTTVEAECGPVAFAYRRGGGLQCAKAPEARDATGRDDAVLACGLHGGTIAAIEFAVWGQAGRPLSDLSLHPTIIDPTIHH